MIKCHIACNTLDYNETADNSGIEQDYEYQPGAIMIDKIISVYTHAKYKTCVKTIDGDVYYVKESIAFIIQEINCNEFQLTSSN